MDKIKQWDHWILDNIYQRVADWVWEIVPVSCFSLARLSIVLDQTCVTIRDIISHRNIIISAMLGIVIIGIFFNNIRQAEESSHLKFMNIYRELCWYLRPIGIVILIPIMIILPYSINDFGVLFFISCTYFLACQPRPPIERTSFQGYVPEFE